jgi:hypothetical protein
MRGDLTSNLLAFVIIREKIVSGTFFIKWFLTLFISDFQG